MSAVIAEGCTSVQSQPLYLPEFLPADQADRLLVFCLGEKNLPWAQERFRLYGKQHQCPRLTAWCGEAGLNYRYGGTDHYSFGWPDELQSVATQISMQLECSYNFLLLNRYEHGAHYMGWHRDDERDCHPQIASLSLGATRRFRFRKGPGHKSEFIDLGHGSLLCFDGRLQHTLTKTKRSCSNRINLTFRQLQNSCA